MARIEPVFGSIGSELENPYKPSDAQLIDEEVVRFSKPKIFDFSGRISLARYWLIHVPFVVFIPTVLLAFFIAGLRDQLIVLFIVAATILIPTCLLSVSLLMRRARDLGWSPAWGVMCIFPVIGFIIVLPLTMLPGRKTTNKYGPPNPPLTTQGNILTLLLVVLTFVSSFVVVMYFREFSLSAMLDWLGNSWNGTQG